MKLIKTNKNTFIVENFDGLKHEFANRDIAVCNLVDSGIQQLTIMAALADMEAKGNDVAHFGIRGTFIFTDKLKGN